MYQVISDNLCAISSINLRSLQYILLTTTKRHTLPSTVYNLSKIYSNCITTLYPFIFKLRHFAANIPNFRNLSYHYRYCCLSLEIHLRDLQQLRKYEKPNKNIAQTAIVICISKVYKIIYPKTCYRESNPLLLVHRHVLVIGFLVVCLYANVRKYVNIEAIALLRRYISYPYINNHLLVVHKQLSNSCTNER